MHLSCLSLQSRDCAGLRNLTIYMVGLVVSREQGDREWLN